MGLWAWQGRNGRGHREGGSTGAIVAIPSAPPGGVIKDMASRCGKYSPYLLFQLFLGQFVFALFSGQSHPFALSLHDRAGGFQNPSSTAKSLPC